MKVTLDYLTGPVLGHKRRCEILKKVLVAHGHEVGQFDEPDWLVVDYPKEQFPKRASCKFRMVMGVLPLEKDDWTWHPLAVSTANTLTGVSWLILDSKLADYRDHSKRDEVLVTCGGADPFHLTEEIIKLIKPDAVIIGPKFNRPMEISSDVVVYAAPEYEQMMGILASYKTIVCSWGTTVFESLYLGAKVYPITLSSDHMEEAHHLGIMVLRKESIHKLSIWMDETSSWDIERPPIDLLGAARLCSFMERFC